MIEMPAAYQTPRAVEMAFSLEGPLCQSSFGSGNEGWEEDPDMPDIFF